MRSDMKHAEITLPVSQITLTVRRQPAGVLKSLRVRAEQINAGTKPKPPIQKVQTGPEITAEIEVMNDPAYQERLREWEGTVGQTFQDLMSECIAQVGVVSNEVLTPYLEEGRHVQAAYKTMGLQVPEGIMAFTLSYIVAQAQEDMATLMFEVFGKALPSQEMVALRRNLFPSEIPTPVN